MLPTAYFLLPGESDPSPNGVSLRSPEKVDRVNRAVTQLEAIVARKSVHRSQHSSLILPVADSGRAVSSALV